MLLILIAVLIKVSHQQSVVVTGWYGTGKSVKYMTIANNLVSSDGNIVPNRFKPRKEGSSTVYDCVDVQGTVRRHGDQYMRPNKRFKYTCTNGVEEVKSCMSSERIGLVEIPVGQTLTKDGLWYNCTHFPQNQTAIYTEAKACEVNNRTYGVGDTIRTGFFLMECTENGYKVIGCYYIDKDKKIVDMVPGSMRKSEGQEYYCNITGNNPKYYVQDVSCKRYGRTLQDGEQFLANHLQYECRNGLVKIIGCYIQENGKILSPGQDVIEKNMVYRCYRVNSTLHYVEYACGYNGTPNCQPEPMKNEPEESVGTYNRGFAVQSVVSQIQRASSQFMTGSNATYANLSGIATING